MRHQRTFVGAGQDGAGQVRVGASDISAPAAHQPVDCSTDRWTNRSGAGSAHADRSGDLRVLVPGRRRHDSSAGKHHGPAVGAVRRLPSAREGKPITYLIAQVDNQSDDTINMYEVVVVTNAGQQIEATSISDYVDSWRNSFAGGEGTDAENFSRGIELSNASNFALLPGAKGTAILGAKEPITTVKRVFVYPAGPFDRVEARRIK
jgi:hypothetical protein